MAASTSTPIATSSPAFTMNPTSTEHDWRFPRRPVQKSMQPDGDGSHGTTAPTTAAATTSATAGKTSTSDIGTSLGELKLDFSTTFRLAHDELLKAPVVRAGGGRGVAGAANNVPSADEMLRRDPLMTEVWRFFTQTKQLLPERERMENMTWRMMALKLRRDSKEQQSR